jgi:type IV secretion system protein VirB9
LQAWDDGVHTHLRFNQRTELPALFVRNDDHTESLLNFSVEHDEVVIHRIARRFTVRRGKLIGCIVNRGFQGSGIAPDTGTVSSEVERATRTSSSQP